MRIICIGDSLTEGYVTKNNPKYYPYSKTLKKVTRHKKIDNVGMSGKTSDQILRHLQNNVRLDRYDTAIILAGTNDLLRRSSAYILKKLKAIHNYCLHQGISHVYALSLPQIHFERPLRESKRLALNSNLRRWCESNPQEITYIPFGEDFMYDRTSSLWAHNGYHLSPAGYTRMGTYLSKRVIKK